MKKQLIIVLAACLCLISCKKSDDGFSPEPVKEYFRGKLNGIAFIDTTKARTFITQEHGFQISGFHPNGGINLVMRPFTSMTGENPVNQGNHIFLGNQGAIFFAGSINGKVQGSGKINITEITSSYVRGTFEGIVPADSNWAVLPTQVITEGEFNLRRRR